MSCEWNVRFTNSNRSGLRIREHNIETVFSSFRFSLLQSIHNFTSEMQICMRWTVVSKCSGWQDQEVERSQEKVDWIWNDIRSSLKVVLCTR